VFFFRRRTPPFSQLPPSCRVPLLRRFPKKNQRCCLIHAPAARFGPLGGLSVTSIWTGMRILAVHANLTHAHQNFGGRRAVCSTYGWVVLPWLRHPKVLRILRHPWTINFNADSWVDPFKSKPIVLLSPTTAPHFEPFPLPLLSLQLIVTARERKRQQRWPSLSAQPVRVCDAIAIGTRSQTQNKPQKLNLFYTVATLWRCGVL